MNEGCSRPSARRGGRKPLSACSTYTFGGHLAQSLRIKPSESFLAHREALREIVARHGVTRPRVFGSAARGEGHEGSDLDLLIDPAPTTTLFTLAALQLDAERLLGVSVDVLTPRSLPRGSRDRILSEAVPV